MDSHAATARANVPETPLEDPKARRARLAERRRMIWALRLSGQSHEDIARIMKVTVRTVCQACAIQIAKTQRDLQGTAKEWVAQSVARVEAIVSSHWQNRREPRHAYALLAAEEFKARLMGYLAPVRVQAQVDARVSVEAVAPAFDPSRLTNAELRELKRLLQRATTTKPEIDVTPAKGEHALVAKRDAGGLEGAAPEAHEHIEADAQGPGDAGTGVGPEAAGT